MINQFGATVRSRSLREFVEKGRKILSSLGDSVQRAEDYLNSLEGTSSTTKTKSIGKKGPWHEFEEFLEQGTKTFRTSEEEKETDDDE